MKEFCMKYKGWLIVGITLLIPIVAASCGSGGGGGGGARGGTDSEVIVRRIDSNAAMRVRVFIDGRQTGTLRIGETATYRIKSGEHTIFVNSDSYADREPHVLEFTSNQSRHVFSVTDGILAPLSLPGHMGDTYSSYDLDSAIKASFEIIMKELKNKTKVAVINIAADNPNEGNFVIEELTYLMVHSKKKFVVIDRRKIEAIRVERNFSRTSDMEDDFLISIGHLLGAEVVLTGNLNGQADLRRLRIKALNVKTGQLIGMASERV
jgi:hypothetical protein